MSIIQHNLCPEFINNNAVNDLVGNAKYEYTNK